ncbi:hypothetical protein PQX77_018876, partial [Marasmius sp. AFHP31]
MVAADPKVLFATSTTVNSTAYGTVNIHASSSANPSSGSSTVWFRTIQVSANATQILRQYDSTPFAFKMHIIPLSSAIDDDSELARTIHDVVGSSRGLGKESIIPLQLLIAESKRWALVDVCKAIHMDVRDELIYTGVIETPMLTTFVCGVYYDPENVLEPFRVILENPSRKAPLLTTLILRYKGYSPVVISSIPHHGVKHLVIKLDTIQFLSNAFEVLK